MENAFNFKEALKGNRKNFQPEGFDFDVNTFEDLIETWTPIDVIPQILHCDWGCLEAFCRKVYNMNYKETYNILAGMSDALMRRAMKGLAQSGNQTALNIVAKHFMKLDEDKTQNVNITILNDLKTEEEKEDDR